MKLDTIVKKPGSVLRKTSGGDLRLNTCVYCTYLSQQYLVTRCYMTQETLKMAAQAGQPAPEKLISGFTSLPDAAA